MSGFVFTEGGGDTDPLYGIELNAQALQYLGESRRWFSVAFHPFFIE
jgi:hypothetical protein